MLENIEVERSEPPAKIIVNSRTGTLVISGNVKVTPAAVSHGTLSVRVSEDLNVDGGDATAIGDGAQANAAAAACQIRILKLPKIWRKLSYLMLACLLVI